MLLVFKKSLYVESLWVLCCNTPSPQSQMLQGYLLCGLHVPSFVAGPSLLNGWVKFAPRPAGWSSLHVGPSYPWCRVHSSEGETICRGTDVGRCHLLWRAGWELLCRGQPVRAGSAGQVQQDSSGLEHVILTTLIENGRNGIFKHWASYIEEERVKKKKKVSTSASVLRESSTRSLPLWHIYIFKLVSGSSLWLRYFSICCFCAETRSKWVCGVSLCVSPSRAISVSHSLPALPDRRPLGFQSLAFLRGFICLVSFPRLGSPVWGLTPVFSAGTSVVVEMFLLLVDHHPEDLGSDSTASLPLHCHYVALTLYF